MIEKGDSGQKALISYNMPAFAVIYSPEIFVQEYLPVLKELLNGDEQPKQPIASSLHHVPPIYMYMDIDCQIIGGRIIRNSY